MRPGSEVPGQREDRHQQQGRQRPSRGPPGRQCPALRRASLATRLRKIGFPIR
jgi:hypothetical protein